MPVERVWHRGLSDLGTVSSGSGKRRIRKEKKKRNREGCSLRNIIREDESKLEK